MFRGDLLTIPETLISKLINKEITKIVIIGMGTCHTAAMVIAGNMRAKTLLDTKCLTIIADLSTEFSGFNLKSDMSNTLVIAIAQSGTTIDTNVAVKMAKDRGAHSLAILNKRQGDISFISDTTIYLGNGRDIERAVPSTKTYIGHILVGYLLNHYINNKICKSEKDNHLFLKVIYDLPEQISNTIDNFNSIKLDNCLNNFLTIPNWYLVYDSTNTYLAGLEARIKLSECCYKSIPLLSLEELLSVNVNSSIVIMIAESSISNVNTFLDNMDECGNYVVLLGNSKLVNSIRSNNNLLTKIGSPAVSNNLNIILTIINCQLLSYNIALKLDSRQQYFLQVLNKINNKSNYRSSLKDFLLLEDKNCYISGYPKDVLDTLRKKVTNYLNYPNKKDIDAIKDLLWSLARYSIRPIDTIKHQAKTITVGTQRNIEFTSHRFANIFNNYKYNSLYYKSFYKDSPIPTNEKHKVYIHENNLDYKVIKFSVNFMQYCNNIFDEIPHNKYIVGKNINEDKILKYDIKKKVSGNINNDNVHEQYYLLESSCARIDLISEIEAHTGRIDNTIICTLLGALNSCITLLDHYHMNLDNSRLNNYVETLVNQISHAFKFSEESEYTDQLRDCSIKIKNSANIKFLGNYENYDSAKFLSLLLMKKFRKPCSFDILENHKHIDMSAQPYIIFIISNILDDIYQNDVYSEIEKAHSHNNEPFIVTNTFDNRFDDTDMTTLKLPCFSRGISLLIYVICFRHLLF